MVIKWSTGEARLTEEVKAKLSRTNNLSMNMTLDKCLMPTEVANHWPDEVQVISVK